MKDVLASKRGIIEFETPKITNLARAQFGIMTKELTFNFLERLYATNIGRYKVLSGPGFENVKFDGILEDGDKLKLIEIRTSQIGYIPIIIIKEVLLENMSTINNMIKVLKRKLNLH